MCIGVNKGERASEWIQGKGDDAQRVSDRGAARALHGCMLSDDDETRGTWTASGGVCVQRGGRRSDLPETFV